MTPRPLRPLSGILLVAILFLAGCGSGGGDHAGHEGHGEAPPVAEGARPIEVTATSFAFTPDDITITAGEDVAILLTAVDAEHDFVIDEVDFHLSAESGETAEGGLRIDEAGVYTAYCSVSGHREAGMEATVTVTES